MPNINDATINLIKEFEGCECSVYHGAADRAGVYTIGYGCIKYPPFYNGGRSVRMGDPDISKEQALQFLKYEIEEKAQIIEPLLRADLSPNQFGALVSFAFNLGENALKDSTLRKKVNANPADPSIRGEFMKWNMSNGKHIDGLTRRREAESNLYFSCWDRSDNCNS